ncbi:GMC family oxidoreductase [Methylomonas montana]|uniref:GMC oxidoreductase n=1 Tax=Methylomonas montana TaxID=3058963 RepID=UPI00265A7B44|nr:GMC family oxidoreductase [Methylomonas montana]WKJ89568.1 GMC family oxidoreductase [Methylomonas montana]
MKDSVLNDQTDNPEDIDWDYIIVGTGIGGATLGFRLAQEGKKVLFCEKGRSLFATSGEFSGDYAEQFFPIRKSPSEEDHEVLEQSGRWPFKIKDVSAKKTKSFIPFMGVGTGGSSSLYGAAMERFKPEDFEAGRWHFDAEESSIPEKWPITYDELSSYYELAEKLYRVRGDNMSFAAPPLSNANKELYDFLQKQGMHPYRLPIACEFSSNKCNTCQGYLCSEACKNDSSKICLEPALTRYGATLLDQCEVEKIHSSKNKITAIHAEWKGSQIRLKGKHFVLAAGALVTPVILLRSATEKYPSGLANHSGMVGKNLMRHFVDMYVFHSGIKPQKYENIKEIAFNDFYCSTKMKFGTVQSFGWMPPADILVETIEQDIHNTAFAFAAYLYRGIKPIIRPMVEQMLCNRLILASTLEDLPYTDNRVFPDGNSGIKFTYKIKDYDKRRIKRFRTELKQVFKPLRHILIKQAENNERLAHVCGTCRMGDDPATSVVDKFNRVHDFDNLTIIDSSFFPSSGGANPSLTIAANALRVADHLLSL